MEDPAARHLLAAGRRAPSHRRSLLDERERGQRQDCRRYGHREDEPVVVLREGVAPDEDESEPALSRDPNFKHELPSIAAAPAVLHPSGAAASFGGEARAGSEHRGASILL